MPGKRTARHDALAAHAALGTPSTRRGASTVEDALGSLPCLATVILFCATVGCSSAPEPQAPADASADLGADFDARPDAGDGGADASAVACDPRFLADGDTPFQLLSEFCLFDGPMAEHVLDPSVVPFSPIAVLYADDSLKDRFVALPPGTAAQFDAEGRWTWPEGTILGKTFYYHHDARDPSLGRQLLETRLLVKRAGSWEALIYIWNDDATDATFDRLGKWVEIDRIDEAGVGVASRYRIPNKNQCNSCHEQADVLVPLGPRTFQLNADHDYGDGPQNQLTYWAQRGILEGVPEDPSSLPALVDPGGDASAEERARSYLEVNCAHCHNSDGAADPSGLKLGVDVTDPWELGVCRSPVAAGEGSGGFFYDIVPGSPDESIMVFRMSSVDPEIKMPELPTQTADDFGVRLVSEWISGMSPHGCP